MVETEKILGVHIDDKLQYANHIDSVCKTLNYKLFTLRRIKKYLLFHTRKLYYNAYILPSINYCLTIWGNAPKQDMDRLFKLQKRAARIILDANPDSFSKPLFEKLGWLTIYELVDLYKYILLYKIFSGMTPAYLYNLFEFHSSTSYNLRSKLILILNYLNFVGTCSRPLFSTQVFIYGINFPNALDSLNLNEQLSVM